MTGETAPQSALTHSEKNFKPSVVEADLYSWWERSGFFAPNDSEKTFVMMLPLPNITGDLHLGHALGFGGYEDLMARWHRMLGDATLYMPGTDHAGIIAQIVVEKHLAQESVGRDGLGRQEFLAEMWKWMDHYRPRIEQQLRRLGCSLDWSRPNFTMEPSKQRAVRTHFIRLYRAGLLYRADRIVHWCLTCQTTYSDLEALHVERTDTLSYVKYPWADGAADGAPDLVIATTRPETILADVAVAVHPDDERWRPYIGRDVLVPVVERRVKVIADEAVDPSFGTGALKITPGHDATDFEIGQRHHLPVLTVIGKDGRMLPAAGALAGLDRDRARKDMVDRLRKGGLLVKEEPITHSVGIHDRCETVEEPLVLPQWWVKMKPLAEPAIAAVRTGRIKILPEHQERIYFNWMENIRDWAVSRQIWWGHEIPVWYCRDCNETIVPDEDEPDPTRCPKCRSDDLRKDPDVLDTWFSSCLWPFSTLGWPDKTRDLARFYPGTVLETGYDIIFFWVARMIVMGLQHMGEIPFSTVYLHGLVRTGGQKMSKSKGNVESPMRLIEEYGADALRFGLVVDSAAGMDMQISEAKLTNAREFTNKLWNLGRYVLRQIDRDPDYLGSMSVDKAPDVGLHDEDRWIISRTEHAVSEATRLLKGYLFGEYARFMQGFAWGEFADKYVELSKVALRDEGRKPATIRTLAYVLDRTLRLLHPVMPFVTETLALQLWGRIPTAGQEPSLVIAGWPAANPRDLDLEGRFDELFESASAANALRQEAGLPSNRRVTAGVSAERVPFNGMKLQALVERGPDRGIADVMVDGKVVGPVDAYSPSPQVDLVELTRIPLSPGPHKAEIRASGTKNASSSGYSVTILEYSSTGISGQVMPLTSASRVVGALANADVSIVTGIGPARIVGTTEVSVAVERNRAADRARLERELAEARIALARSEELLTKPGFAEKAPANIVETERSRLTERRERVRLLQEELDRV